MAVRQRPRKSQNWLLTPHFSHENYAGKEDEWFKDTLVANDMVIACAGQRETCPTTGAEHMQLFVRLSKRVRLTRMVQQPVLGLPCDVRMGDGKWDAMKAYCTREMFKEGSPHFPGRKRKLGHEAFDEGEWPGPNGKRNDLLFMVEYAQEDRGRSSYAEAAIATNGACLRYRGAYFQLIEEVGTPRDMMVPHTAEWYFGEGRIGKSFLAASENPDAYRKTTGNRWWPQYKGQKTVIFDEFAGRSGQDRVRLPAFISLTYL